MGFKMTVKSDSPIIPIVSMQTKNCDQYICGIHRANAS